MEQKIPINKRIIHRVVSTEARKVEGNLEVDFIVVDGGEAIQRSFIVEDHGQQELLNALAGGLHIATTPSVKPPR